MLDYIARLLQPKIKEKHLLDLHKKHKDNDDTTVYKVENINGELKLSPVTIKHTEVIVNDDHVVLPNRLKITNYWVCLLDTMLEDLNNGKHVYLSKEGFSQDCDVNIYTPIIQEPAYTFVKLYGKSKNRFKISVTIEITKRCGETMQVSHCTLEHLPTNTILTFEVESYYYYSDTDRVHEGEIDNIPLDSISTEYVYNNMVQPYKQRLKRVKEYLHKRAQRVKKIERINLTKKLREELQ